jgi:protein involved in polysaccharide export with SLBB domain
MHSLQKGAAMQIHFRRCSVVFVIIAVCCVGTSSAEPVAEQVAVYRSKQIAAASDSLPFKPGDAVRILALPDTSSFLAGVYPIDQQGYVHLPLLVDARVDTMTLLQLRDFINARYVNYLRYPTASVEPLIRVSLLGGFHHPGLYYFSSRESLWDAVRLAGGTLRDDGMQLLRWERAKQVISSDLSQFIEAGTSLDSMKFISGDQIVVTAKPRLNGWEIFRDDALPIISFVAATATTVASLYIAVWTSQRN